MIKVNIKRDADGFIWSFTVKGHAGYAPEGRDIICAYVSGIVYTALGGLDELADVRNYTEEDGLIALRIPLDILKEKKPVVRIILETMVVGLRQLENQYSEYIEVLDWEV